MGIKHYILFFSQILCFSSLEALPLGKNTTLVFEIQDRNLVRKNNVVNSIWEKETSTLCDIQKPSDSKLDNKIFIEFNRVPVLCMVLFDASLRYLQLNASLTEDLKFNYTEIIDGMSTDTICQKMKENKWFTTIQDNKKWVSKFNETIKNEYSCRSYCVTEIVNPLCALTLWLDSSVKQVERAILETNKLKNSGNVKAENTSITNFTKEVSLADTRTDNALSPTVTKQAGDAQVSSSKDVGHGNNLEGSINKMNTVILNNGDGQALHRSPQDSEKASNVSNLAYQRGNHKLNTVEAIMATQSETTEHLHSGNSHENPEKDRTRKKPLTKSPSAKSLLVPDTDYLRPNDNRQQEDRKTEPFPEELEPVRSDSSSKNVLLETKEPISMFAGKSNEKPEGGKSNFNHKTPEGHDPVVQGMMIGGSSQVTGSQKTLHNSTTVEARMTLAPVSALFPKHEENNNPGKDVLPSAPGSASLLEPKENNNSGKERPNTTDSEAKKKEKSEIPKGHTAEISKPLDQIGGSENVETNQAEMPEFDGEPVEEPDDHEDQKKLDDGAINGQVEDNQLGVHGDANLPQESEDDTIGMQEIPTAESRFNEMDEGSPPKPDPSTKVEDYAGTSDEDDDSQWHPEQGRVTLNDADAGFAHDRFVDTEDSHFFAYFMTMIILCILGYVIFHNKQKILALALEGRVRKGSRRRPSTSGYRKLDSNLEEAVTSNCTGSSVTHVIY